MGEKLKRSVSELFLQDKPSKILIYLKKENKPLYTAIISREVDATYAHTLNVLADFKKLKFVSFKESGRIKLVNLTELGSKAAGILISFIDLLELGEIEREMDQTYEKEIKGKLREEMNKEAISKQFDKLKAKLNRYIEEKPTNVSILARKLLKKADDVLAEAFGYPPG
ncbi:MAG: hypothetical protein QMD95_03370 [Candidatus Hodarchaeaceae archaeon]|nr:hypothetical protein [Candidatus Hodarchaeaceae archaeon]